MRVHIINTLEDNFSYLAITNSGVNAVIDPGEAAPIIKALEEENLTLDFIINTHHHHDHINGNQELKARYNAQIAAPAKDAYRIPDINIMLHDKDILTIGDQKLEVIETPGHTNNHICLYNPEFGYLFCGDTLFSLGCGRLFEGTADQMFHSLQKLLTLPDEASILPGHEYTKANAEFCLHIEPDNLSLKERIKDIDERLSKNLPTIPVTLGIEKETNVFLKAKTAEQFARLRSQKDNF